MLGKSRIFRARAPAKLLHSGCTFTKKFNCRGPKCSHIVQFTRPSHKKLRKARFPRAFRQHRCWNDFHFVKNSFIRRPRLASNECDRKLMETYHTRDSRPINTEHRESGCESNADLRACEVQYRWESRGQKRKWE